MVVLKIVKDSNPELRKKCAEVPLPLSKEHQELIEEMMSFLKLSQDEEYRKKHPKVREGVGLAAPQIGKNLRMLVISFAAPTEENPDNRIEWSLVNPKIVANSIRKAYLDNGEGCLSVDDPHEGYVYRDYKIVVSAYNHLTGQNERIEARGYPAIVLQHEIDHLDGILFYDRIDQKNPFKKIVGAVAI